mmetsp:Transcript_97091/g.142070  ORF Transcript_97091/g.142070 Transcript_97091/m.142070 type:complete len:301 (+) Transcript_97091:45-947(+)
MVIRLLVMGLLGQQATCFAPFPSLPASSRHPTLVSFLSSAVSGRYCKAPQSSHPLLRYGVSASLSASATQVDTAALQHHGTRYILGRLAVQVALVLAVFVFPPMHAHAKGGLTMDRSEPAEQARLIDTSMNANPHRIGPAEYLLANVQSAVMRERLEAEAEPGTTPVASEDDTWEGWTPITRKQLLQMKHSPSHVEHHVEHATATGIFAPIINIFLTPLSTVLGTLKLMFPLMMITVPICYVFPWELVSGGYKDSTKMFRSGSPQASDKKTRDFALFWSTVVNFLLALSFGSGGGGGGHH